MDEDGAPRARLRSEPRPFAVNRYTLYATGIRNLAAEDLQREPLLTASFKKQTSKLSLTTASPCGNTSTHEVRTEAFKSRALRIRPARAQPHLEYSLPRRSIANRRVCLSVCLRSLSQRPHGQGRVASSV